ncbi:type II toxin-antitoxin system RelE/ParE family toxin [Mixta gaviniae]|uniref:type II toxin-antitoxin system RelE/ParE family toxin n=1 Tax=Mixta gaviniae TaxID=665914 RepID=UPI003182C0BF
MGDAWRAVYAVKPGDAIYLLHVFRRESSSGIAMAKADRDNIRERRKAAENPAKGAEQEPRY